VGFEADPSGWGCRPVLPDATCPDGFIAQLGSRACVPLSDCIAPFPPPEATFFVDQNFPDGRLDATHFRKLWQAADAAPAGATIAIESGTYVEANGLTRDVNLVGRCSAEVRILPPAPGLNGVYCEAKVNLRGVALVGHAMGFGAGAGCQANLREVEILSPASAGLAANSGATVTLHRSRIVGAQGQPGLNGGNAAGVLAQGGSVTLEGCEVADNNQIGVGASGAGSTVAVVGSVVRGTRDHSMGDWFGGAYVDFGGQLSLERSALVDNSVYGLRVIGAASRAVVVSSTVSGSRGAGAESGAGIGCSQSAALLLVDSAVVTTEGPGVLVFDGDAHAELNRVVLRDNRRSPNYHDDLGEGLYLAGAAHATVTDCAIIGNRRAGIELQPDGSTLEVTGSLIADTGLSGPDEDIGGFGLYAKQASVSVTDSAFTGNRLIGVYAQYLAKVTLARTLVRATTASPRNPTIGHGVVASNESVLDVTETAFDENLGVGVACMAADCAVRRSLIRRNAVGLHTDQATVISGDAPAPAGDFVVRFDEATLFEGNGLRVGGGPLPLPSMAAAGK
jgi:hypothetical protein